MRNNNFFDIRTLVTSQVYDISIIHFHIVIYYGVIYILYHSYDGNSVTTLKNELGDYHLLLSMELDY